MCRRTNFAHTGSKTLTGHLEFTLMNRRKFQRRVLICLAGGTLLLGLVARGVLQERAAKSDVIVKVGSTLAVVGGVAIISIAQ